MIRAENLVKHYGPVIAVDGVSFELERGRTLGIIGPNGAGKTTLIKILLGLVLPTSGTVIVDGVDLNREPVAVRHRIGYVPQRAGFEDSVSARSALEFLARLRRVPTSAVEPAARAVGVDHLLSRTVGTLSGGQKQRLSLAAALLGDPPVLLLDEPTASLDPRATADFRSLVQTLSSEGRTILLCSHLLDDVERLCHRVLVLLDGRVASDEQVDASQSARGRLEVQFLETVKGTHHG